MILVVEIVIETTWAIVFDVLHDISFISKLRHLADYGIAKIDHKWDFLMKHGLDTSDSRYS